jgi:hypothetical protein
MRPMSSRREADTAPGVTVLVLTGVSARRRRAGSFMAALAALGFTALLLSSGINVVDVIASAILDVMFMTLGTLCVRRVQWLTADAIVARNFRTRTIRLARVERVQVMVPKTRTTGPTSLRFCGEGTRVQVLISNPISQVWMGLEQRVALRRALDLCPAETATEAIAELDARIQLAREVAAERVRRPDLPPLR